MFSSKSVPNISDFSQKMGLLSHGLIYRYKLSTFLGLPDARIKAGTAITAMERCSVIESLCMLKTEWKITWGISVRCLFADPQIPPNAKTSQNFYVSVSPFRWFRWEMGNENEKPLLTWVSSLPAISFSPDILSGDLCSLSSWEPRLSALQPQLLPFLEGSDPGRKHYWSQPSPPPAPPKWSWSTMYRFHKHHKCFCYIVPFPWEHKLSLTFHRCMYKQYCNSLATN